MAQFAPEQRALKNIQKERWDKAHAELTKVISKEPENVTARYVMAQYFFAPNNSGFNIDSACRYAGDATERFLRASLKDRTRMKRFPVDSTILLNFRQRVDSAAFERARAANTEAAYLDFLERFPGALQHVEAAALRDEAAYQEALSRNTLVDFQRYLERYPNATRAADARQHYERHLFEQETHDKRLESYERFVKRFPKSPHRAEAERSIFYLATAAGSEAAFENFLSRHPRSAWSSRAQNILYHLTPQEERSELVNKFQNDSLRVVLHAEKSYLVPFLHNNLFGFMDKDGVEAIASYEEDIEASQRCGNVTDDILLLSGKLVNRQGVTLVSENVVAAEDLGNGFLLVEKTDCNFVLHKSGFTVGDSCVQDAKLICGNFLATRKNNGWSIWTLAGYPLLTETADEIRDAGNIVVIQSDQKIRLATSKAIVDSADQLPLKLSDVFEETKPWSESMLWVRSGNLQGVLNQSLEVHIPFDEGQLSSTYFGAIRNGNMTTLYNRNGAVIATGKAIKIQQPWVLINTGSYWTTFDPLSEKFDNIRYDSAYFRGPFVVGMNGDTLHVHMNRKLVKEFHGPVQIDFIPGRDSMAFMVVTDPKQKTLYNQSGKKLFAVTSERVQHAGRDFFIVTKKDKKGLASADGKLLLPQEFDAIGTIQDDNVSILKSGRFGIYNCRKKKLIKPEYTKNLSPYTPDILLAYKDGAWGFVKWDNKPVSRFEFADVKYWTDSVALVKIRSTWQLFNIYTGEIELDKIRKYTVIRDTPDEKLYIIQQENRFGVISSIRGVVIPISFSDIVNVGSAEEPLYFTEKHVEEASLFVVIYYSAEGKFIRKEVYEQDDYERIYCSR